MTQKAWDFIGEISEKWVKDSYPTAKSQDVWKIKDRLNEWFKFLEVTDSEFLEVYKRTKDKTEWSKKYGFQVIAFYNSMVQKGYATNTARSYASTPRAFCRDVCIPLIVRKGKIAKPKSGKGEHEFTREELAKMFYVADVRDKAILSSAVSLGFSVKPFAELPRKLVQSLIDKAVEEKIDFIGFDYERKKEGVESRSHLTPEARDSLKAWFEYVDKKREGEGKPSSKWVWANGNGEHLSVQALNDVIKNLVQKANIVTTGKVRFHLLRKFLMNALHDANFSDWEVKRAIGKEIPTSDDTYLKGLSRKVSEKFPSAYDYIRLSGYANKNHLRIEDLEAKILTLEMKLESMAVENQTLKRVIEYSIPKDKIQTAIIRIAKENNIDFRVGKHSGTPLDSSKPYITLEELLTILKQPK